MGKKIKSFFVTILVLSLILSSSCDSLFGDDKDAVVSNGSSEVGTEISDLIALKNTIDEIIDSLVNFDADELKTYGPVSDKDYQYIKEFSFEETFGAGSEVYKALLSTLTYEIVDENDTATGNNVPISVVFSCIDLSMLSPEDFSSSSWIEAIEDSDELRTFPIEFHLGTNEEGIPELINSIEVISEFYDELFSPYVIVDNFVFYDDAVQLSCPKDNYYIGEKMEIILDYSDLPTLDNKRLFVDVIDSSGKVIYETTTSFSSTNEDNIFVFIDNTILPDSYLEISVYSEDYSIDCYKRINIYKPELQKTVLDCLFEYLVEVDETSYGSFDNGIYSNAVIGLSYSLPEGMNCIDSAMGKPLSNAENCPIVAEYMFVNEDMTSFVANFIAYTYEEDLDDSIAQIIGIDSGLCKKEVNGETIYVLSQTLLSDNPLDEDAVASEDNEVSSHILLIVEDEYVFIVFTNDTLVLDSIIDTLVLYD